MSILVFGKTGQVARALSQFEDVICLGRDEADLINPEICGQKILDMPCEAVINAAAYTAVDKAEEEEPLATLINGVAPAKMAEACARKNVPFVHISTDYVFDGSGEKSWVADDPTSPLNAYGRSKREGERGVQNSGAVFAILRTSWVFSPTGQNFVNSMLRLGAERDKLNIVADQVGGPTPASAIAEACMQIARGLGQSPEQAGFYHFSGSPNVTWAEFANSIFEVFDIDCVVQPISSEAFPSPAQRPLNSRLCCRSLEEVFLIKRPNWLNHLAEFR